MYTPLVLPPGVYSSKEERRRSRKKGKREKAKGKK
jgi:hypothetical protein